MNKLFFIFILFILLATEIFSQTPMYYNTNSGASNNVFPFSVMAGKEVQWLILAGDYNTPSPVPAGNNITKLYFYMGASVTNTLTDLTIKLGQADISSLPVGIIYTGQLDTVYFRSSVTLSSTIASWMQITLDRPFPYDITKSLIIDVSQCGATSASMTVRQSTGSGVRRNYINGTPSCVFTYAGQDASIINSGIDAQPPPPPALPPFYNYQISGGANSFPFNVAAGKEIQWLVNPHEFNQPSGMAPLGDINAVYFYMAGAATHTFNHLLIKFGLTTLTSLPPGVIYSGQMDTVYYKDTITLTSALGAWMVIPLTHNFTYDTSKSLVLDISQCGYTGTGNMTVNQQTITPVRRCYINGTTSCVFTYAGQDGTIANCGINVLTLTGVHHNSNIIPTEYSLDQNYPNPFNPTTIINFNLPKSGVVDLRIYDILGREVSTLIHEFKTAGKYSVDFNGNNISSGVYFYTLKSGDFKDTKKMLLVK